MTKSSSPIVQVWEDEISLPTYAAYAPDPNPMFLEKRVYQGSSGKIYPNAFTDRISIHPSPHSYRAIHLENEYVEITLLPELGGRIFSGRDKTNGYDFFYRQTVIKPALVGLLGPWISGGVEFNWPQHHRPSTYMPAQTAIEHGSDGSVTVWMSEHEPMQRMKGMVGICLRPGRSVLEARVRLYNRTPSTQTFLWWANVAVRVDENYQAFFPPDVTFVADHAKRAVSHFPFARNFYYGVDYTQGVDLRWYKNIPVPTSYMVTQSNFDFFGGYDHAREAGFVHVANRHIAPGKKMWTWGSGEFGQAWDRNLTDTDGPYIELMAGVYTDNQPDFSWLHPYETKQFSQFWYPIQKIGPVAFANLDCALSLRQEHGQLLLGIGASRELKDCSLQVFRDNYPIFEQRLTIAPGRPWEGSLPQQAMMGLRFIVGDASGNLLLDYCSATEASAKLPEPATEPAPPEEIASADELYITGLHLEQYHHATRAPEPYWREGLSRDPGDARMNNAMGLVALHRGEFDRAATYFQAAVARLTRRNPNPRDGEAFYNLGLALQWQGRLEEAYAAFYKATWNYAWRAAGHYALAQIRTRQGDVLQALTHLEMSLFADAAHLKARNLKASLLRKLARLDEARATLATTLQMDPLDAWARAETLRLAGGWQNPAEILPLAADLQVALDVGYDYATSGLGTDAREWLTVVDRIRETPSPIILYALAWLADQEGDADAASSLRQRASAAPSQYCFPARLEEMVVLQAALTRTPADAKANYYLGNLYYDKRRYQEAIACWQQSVKTDPNFSIPWRNLGIAEFNIRRNPLAAEADYRRAIAANPEDARLFYEMDQLQKRVGTPPEERLRALEARPDLVNRRDDLRIEYIALLNLCGRHEQALEALRNHRFNPWEGGEGLVSGQYVRALVAIARRAIDASEFDRAMKYLEDARHYPETLGEGKHLLTLERQIDYWQGVAAARSGDAARAASLFQAAAAALPQPSVQSYFRGLALNELGRTAEARAVFEEMQTYAQNHRADTPSIDYFATSLPNFLIFEDDLKKRNQVECLLVEAYAALGLANPTRAQKLFAQALGLDPSQPHAREESERLPGTE